MMWRRKTIGDMLRTELEEARRELLAGETAVEFARSIVSYNQARIKRLKVRLDEWEASSERGQVPPRRPPERV
jgi:hypothetical protein